MELTGWLIHSMLIHSLIITMVITSSSNGLGMAGVRAGIFAGLTVTSGCEVPVVPYGTTSWTSSRRLRRISVGTYITIGCTYGNNQQFQHIHNMYCANRAGSWEFPDDANFTLRMLNQLCYNPREDEMDPEHYSYTQGHSESVMTAVPMVLGAAFILCLLVVMGMVFRSKVRQRRSPILTAHTYLSAEAQTTDDRSDDAPACVRSDVGGRCPHLANEEFWDLSAVPPTTAATATTNVGSPSLCHHLPPHMHCHHPAALGWHDHFLMDQARMFAPYSRPNIESGLPTYEEAMKHYFTQPETKVQKKEPEGDLTTSEEADIVPNDTTQSNSQSNPTS